MGGGGGLSENDCTLKSKWNGNETASCVCQFALGLLNKNRIHGMSPESLNYEQMHVLINRNRWKTSCCKRHEKP